MNFSSWMASSFAELVQKFLTVKPLGFSGDRQGGVDSVGTVLDTLNTVSRQHTARAKWPSCRNAVGEIFAWPLYVEWAGGRWWGPNFLAVTKIVFFTTESQRLTPGWTEGNDNTYLLNE